MSDEFFDELENAQGDPPSMAALFVARTQPLPPYDSAVEITIEDLRAAHGWTRGQATTEMQHSGWVGREVRLPSGRRATAWRPK